MLGPQGAIPAHVQADLANPPPIDQLPRQVRRAVGHDGDTGAPHGMFGFLQTRSCGAKPRVPRPRSSFLTR